MNSDIPLPSTILLVDDEEAVRRLLGRALSDDGHVVSLATSKADALALIERERYDLFLVDKNLPDGSGLDVIAEALRREHGNESIVITGYSDTDSAIQSISLGVFRYVRKPFDLDALRVDINRALETRRLRLELDARTRELQATNDDLRIALDRFRESENRRIQAERLATLGYLAAGVAHEINNPLSLLSMTIPFAVNEIGALNAEIDATVIGETNAQRLARLARSLGPTEEAVEFLMGLAADLHALGRTGDQQPRPFAIVEAARSALRLVRHQLKHKARTVVEVPDDLVISGLQSRLVQVFINLLTNASKALKRGAYDDNEVAIRGRIEGTQAVVEVSDTGCGIPPANLDRVFERFFTTAQSDQEPGSGIGLAIVREMVVEHGGTVDVSSTLDQGTTFTLRFPLSSTRRTISAVPAVVRRDTDTLEIVRTKRTILFVDTERENLEAYEESFGQLHRVLVADGSAQVREVIAEHEATIDAVVCQLGPPDTEIGSLHHQILEQCPDLDGRFIFVGEGGELCEAAELAGFRVLHKPVRPATLLAEIYKILPRRPSEQ